MKLKQCILFAFLTIIVLVACNNNKVKSEENNLLIVHPDSSNLPSLRGTWISHDRTGFTLIEIEDSLNVTYTGFSDSKAYIDTITTDRYKYYKSKAKFGFWNSSTVWIKTSRYRIDYYIKADTLIEFDKMGIQRKLVKVHNYDLDSI